MVRSSQRIHRIFTKNPLRSLTNYDTLIMPVLFCDANMAALRPQSTWIITLQHVIRPPHHYIIDCKEAEGVQTASVYPQISFSGVPGRSLYPRFIADSRAGPGIVSLSSIRRKGAAISASTSRRRSP